MVETTPHYIAETFDAWIRHKSRWTLHADRFRVLDVVNHVLRVVVQLELTRDYVSEFSALSDLQHSDGGWSDRTDGNISGIRNTCFAARNLVRAYRCVPEDRFLDSFYKAVDFILDSQTHQGNWSDIHWGERDATSSAMGLLIYAMNEMKFSDVARQARTQRSLAAAVGYLLSSQAGDGSWPNKSSSEPAVESTCHLLPKLALAVTGQELAIRKATEFIVGKQEINGSWDSDHTDHTCDAVRSLIAAHSVIRDVQLGLVIDKGVLWLKSTRNSDFGWGAKAGYRSTLLINCDVLDCLSKYEAHAHGDDVRRFWQ